MAIAIRELLDEDGGSPFGCWFDDLNALAAAKIVIAKARLEQGNFSNVKWFSGIGECKIDWGPGYRVYLAKDGLDVLLLLGGGTKQTQSRDIERALALWQTYKRRKAAGSKKR